MTTSLVALFVVVLTVVPVVVSEIHVDWIPRNDVPWRFDRAEVWNSRSRVKVRIPRSLQPPFIPDKQRRQTCLQKIGFSFRRI